MSEPRLLPTDLVTYRDGRLLLHPIPKKNDDSKVVGVKGYREEWVKTINGAKRASRALQATGVTVRKGKPL